MHILLYLGSIATALLAIWGLYKLCKPFFIKHWRTLRNFDKVDELQNTVLNLQKEKRNLIEENLQMKKKNSSQHRPPPDIVEPYDPFKM